MYMNMYSVTEKIFPRDLRKSKTKLQRCAVKLCKRHVVCHMNLNNMEITVVAIFAYFK